MSTQKTIVFFNPFEDFTCTWNNEPFTVFSNRKVHMQDWLAIHIRKHLVDRELNKRKLPTDFECSDPMDSRYESSRKQLEARCFVSDSMPMEHGSSVSQELELLNKKEDNNLDASSAITSPNILKSSTDVGRPWCDSCDSKGMRHKKVCPKNRPKDVALASSATP